MRQLNRDELKTLFDALLAKADDKMYQIETDTTAIPVYEGFIGTADVGRPPLGWDLRVESTVYIKVRKIR